MASTFSDISVNSEAPSWELLSNDDSSARETTQGSQTPREKHVEDFLRTRDNNIPPTWQMVSDTNRDDEQQISNPKSHSGEILGKRFARNCGSCGSQPVIPGECVNQVFKQHALEHRDSMAVDAWDGAVTYGELDKLSSKLAHYLCDLGVGPEIAVPLVFEKSLWAIVSTIAVLKAGGAFVPLNFSSTRPYLEKRMGDVHAKILLTSPTHASSLQDLVDTVVVISPHLLNFLDDRDGDPEVAILPTNAATIIFEQDDRGRSKGCVREHAMVCHKSETFAKRWFMHSKTRMLQYADYNDVTSTVDIFAVVHVGACLCVPSDHEIKFEILNVMNDMRITWAAVPCWLPHALAEENIPSLETLVDATGDHRGELGTKFCDRDIESVYEIALEPSDVNVTVEERVPKGSSLGRNRECFHMDSFMEPMTTTQLDAGKSAEPGSALGIMNGIHHVLETMNDSHLTSRGASSQPSTLDITNDTTSAPDIMHGTQSAVDDLNGTRPAVRSMNRTLSTIICTNDPMEGLVMMNGKRYIPDMLNKTSPSLDTRYVKSPVFDIISEANELSVELRSSVKPDKNPSLNCTSAPSTIKNLFLTDAVTSFGAEILRQLLSDTDIPNIIVLVNASDGFAALTKLRDGAERAGWAEDFSRWSARIGIWLGDQNDPRLGISHDQWKLLCGVYSPTHPEGLQAIIHVDDGEALKSIVVHRIATFWLLQAIRKATEPIRFVCLSGQQQLTFENKQKSCDELASTQGTVLTTYVGKQRVSELLIRRFGQDDYTTIVKPGYVMTTPPRGVFDECHPFWMFLLAIIDIKAYNVADAVNWIFISDIETTAKAAVQEILETRAPECRVHSILDGIQLSEVLDLLENELQYEIEPVEPKTWLGMMRTYAAEGGNIFHKRGLLQFLEDRQGVMGVPVSPTVCGMSDQARIKDGIRKSLRYLVDIGSVPKAPVREIKGGDVWTKE